MHQGLECRIGHGRIVVPTRCVERLDELVVAPPLPAWPRRVSGVAVAGDEMVVTVSMSPVPRAAERQVNGLLFQSRTYGLRWALEITAPLGLIEIEELTPHNGDSDARPRWVWSAAASGRTSLLWIDVEGMMAALGEAA